MPNTPLVIQKYIEKPLLYNERKFDIRLWVLVTADLDIYYYKGSYVRTSSSPYELANTQDYLKHLTNNCFQVLSDQYGVHEEGNIISLHDLEVFVKKTKCPDYSIEQHFFPMAACHAVDVVLSGSKKMKIAANSFELFGLDLIIDEDLRVWLIECNVNPHLGSPNAFMRKNVPQMINEMLTITVDPLFPPKELPSKYELGQWELAYNGKFRKREHTIPDGLYPIKELVAKEEEVSISKPTAGSKLPTVSGMGSPTNNISQAHETKTRFVQFPKSDYQDVQQNKPRKDQDLYDELEKMETEAEFLESSDEFSKETISIAMGEPIEKLAERSKTTYSLDLIHDSLLKQFKESYCNINDLGKNIDRLFDILSAPRMYSEIQLCKTLKVIESFLDTQFDYLVISSKNVQSLLGLARYRVSSKLFMKMVDCLLKMLTCRTNLSQFLNNIVEIAEIMGRLVHLSVNQAELKSAAPKITLRYLQVVSQLADSDSKNCYVPGRSNETDLVRKLLVVAGVPIVVAGIVKNQYSLPSSLLAAADKLLATCFSTEDIQLQVDIVTYCEKLSYPLIDITVDDMNKLPSSKATGMLSKMILQKAVKFYRREIEGIFTQQKDKAINFEGKDEEVSPQEKPRVNNIEELTTVATTAETSQRSEVVKKPSLIAQSYWNTMNHDDLLDILKKFEGQFQKEKKKVPTSKQNIHKLM